GVRQPAGPSMRAVTERERGSVGVAVDVFSARATAGTAALSLHDALPICAAAPAHAARSGVSTARTDAHRAGAGDAGGSAQIVSAVAEDERGARAHQQAAAAAAVAGDIEGAALDVHHSSIVEGQGREDLHK